MRLSGKKMYIYWVKLIGIKGIGNPKIRELHCIVTSSDIRFMDGFMSVYEQLSGKKEPHSAQPTMTLQLL